MECSNCGVNIQNDNLFCTECGQQLTIQEITSAPEIVRFAANALNRLLSKLKLHSIELGYIDI